MAFKETNSVLHVVGFSSFLGGCYLATQAAEKAVAEVKASLGDAIIKAGFTGNTGASAEAVNKLKSMGVQFGSPEGVLIGVRKHTVTAQNGLENHYLRVIVQDGDEKYSLSTSLNGRGAQMLIRKLANAAPEKWTKVSIFCKKADFVDQMASLKQDGIEVTGIPPGKELLGLLNAARDALVGAGIPVTDKKTHGNRRAAIEMEYHLGLLGQIEARFNEHFGSSHQEAPEDHGHYDPDGLVSPSPDDI